MIAIIDFGMGNLRSVQKAFERLGLEAVITSDPAKLSNASKLILPGVGNFEQGMQNLDKSGLSDVIREEVLIKGKKIAGICLGMQLLTKSSEEGHVDGLGFVDARTYRFPSGNAGFKIPHMGWNEIKAAKNSDLLNKLNEELFMYFVHSYYIKCTQEKDVLFTTKYGLAFDSGLEHENVIGFQFHPEKSHKPGLQLIYNFAIS